MAVNKFRQSHSMRCALNRRWLLTTSFDGRTQGVVPSTATTGPAARPASATLDAAAPVFLTTASARDLRRKITSWQLPMTSSSAVPRRGTPNAAVTSWFPAHQQGWNHGIYPCRSQTSLATVVPRARVATSCSTTSSAARLDAASSSATTHRALHSQMT